MVSDNDLFKPAAAKPKSAARLTVGLTQRKNHAVQQLDATESAKLMGGNSRQQQQQQQQQQAASPAAGSQPQQPQPAAAAAVTEPHVQVGLVVSPDGDSVAVKLQLVMQPAAGSSAANAAAPAAAGKAPQPGQVTRLPGARRLGFGMALGTRGVPGAAGAGSSGSGGGSGISALMSGAWAGTGGAGAAAAAAAGAAGDAAAAAAAAGQAGGQAAAAPKKAKKRKRVAWRDDRLLVAVRWFVKDDPPVKAKADAHLSDEQLQALVAGHSRHHAAFDQAARREHARERQLIEQQHKEAEDRAAALRQLVAAMRPDMEWPGPPPGVTPEPAWQVAAGEDSQLSKADPRSPQQVVQELHRPGLPLAPNEPHQLLQMPSAFFNVPFHDRNVRIVPLNPVAAAPAAGGPVPMDGVVQQQQMQQMQMAPPQQPQQHLAQQPQPILLQQPGPPQFQQQPLPPQTIVLQAAPQQQQQPQQQLLPGLAGGGGQLLLQPLPQQPQYQQQPQMPQQQQPQQQLLMQAPQQPPPPQHPLQPPQQQPAGFAGLFLQSGPGSSGPPSGNAGGTQAQLLQALQSLTQLQSQGGLPGQPQQQQPPQQQQQQPIMQLQQPQQLQMAPPGSSAPQIIVGADGMQLVLPPGVLPQQILQPPPGMTLPPGGSVVLLQQPPPGQQLFDMRGQPLAPPHHFHELPPPGHYGHHQHHGGPGFHHEQHQQHQQHQGQGLPGRGPFHEQQPRGGSGGPSWGGGRGGGWAGGGGGRGSAAHDGEDENAWRRSHRTCKFFGTARGCNRGNVCSFLHIQPGEQADVRAERRPPR